MTQFLEYLTFDDVLLLPKHSKILPTDADVTTSISTKVKLQVPILSAAMDTVTEAQMAIAIGNIGGLGIIHKNMSIEQQVRQVHDAKIKTKLVGAAIGVGDDGKTRAKALIDAGVDVLAVDTAHGHSQLVLDMVTFLRQNYSDLTIIGGNIATAESAKDLAHAGADAVKVGIGPGSICTTRIVSGVGVPQLSAILNVANALKDTHVKVIADGGIKYSGDIVKALAAGADAVMLGNLLAGTEEAPGEIFELDRKHYKSYRGMGSMGAVTKGSDDRYFQHKRKGKFIAEGVEGAVECKGSLRDELEQLVGGLRLGMGYLGAATLEELKSRAEFIRISNAARQESHIYNLSSVKDNQNYKAGK